VRSHRSRAHAPHHPRRAGVSARPTRVLLVEDDDAIAQLIQLELSDPAAVDLADSRFAVTRVRRLSEALARLAEGGLDVALLDLNLPDSGGLDTFRRLRERSPDLPIVVLSALTGVDLGVRAVREGAQDYLVKGQADGPLLARSLRYAIERRRAERELAARVEVEIQLRALREAEARRLAELRAVERLAAPAERRYAEATARTFGLRPLGEAAPERFAELVEQYGQLLDRALEQRAYKVDHHVSDALRGLADELGFLRAGPRDVVELHTAALRGRIGPATPQRAQAYVEEARVAILELMGHLVAYYRI
jgi:DNA-binding response OmpR family regulator